MWDIICEISFLFFFLVLEVLIFRLCMLSQRALKHHGWFLKNGTKSELHLSLAVLNGFALQHCLASEFSGWTRIVVVYQSSTYETCVMSSLKWCTVISSIFFVCHVVFHVICLSYIFGQEKSGFFATHPDLGRPPAEKPEHWPNWKTSSCCETNTTGAPEG